MSTDVPVHHYTCSVYLFLFGITSTVTFQLIYWGTYTQIYPKIKLPVYLHASLLSHHKDLPVTQLLVYMPIDLPIHYPTCSFWLFHSDKPFVLTCPLTCCSKYSQITFSLICVCVSPGFTCTLICQLICWSAYRHTHPKMNVPANFDATWYVSLPVHLQTRLSTHRSCSSWSFLSS